MSGWIGVDLDGTLAHYDEWRGIDHIGKPIPEMVQQVISWIKDGREVRIFTARVWDSSIRPEDTESAKVIQKWCLDHIGVELPVTCTKDFEMIELWDDRAVQVEMNTGRRVDGK